MYRRIMIKATLTNVMNNVNSERKPAMKLSASILSADHLRLGEEIERAVQAGCELMHLDVMDGHFVPNLAVGLCTIEALRHETRLRKDAHLMISNPEAMIAPFIRAGVDSITIHAESTPHHIRLLREIKKAGIRAGIALTPETPVEAVLTALPEVDIVLQVSVCVGFGGQKFIAPVFEKLRQLRAYKERFGYGYEIQVDGGITFETAATAAQCGAEVLVAGSALFCAADMRAAAESLRAATPE